MKILFVCLGNICRSPMADGIMIQLLKDNNLSDKVEVDSAGTEPYHVGETADKRAIKVSKEYGIDIQYHRARQIELRDFEYYDRIYTMAMDVNEDVLIVGNKKQYRDKVILFMDVLSPGKYLSVPDPWHGTEGDFKAAFKIIDKVCRLIVQELEEEMTAKKNQKHA
jgi:protein-tyrosine phosphatase